MTMELIGSVNVEQKSAMLRADQLQLILGTGAFFVRYAVYGSVGAMMPLVVDRLKLSNTHVGFALAVPVILGSLGRVPLGVLTDRLCGRAVYIAVMAFSILPALILGWATSYWQVLGGACWRVFRWQCFP